MARDCRSVLANHEAALTFRDRMRGAVLAVAIVDLPEHHERSEMFELTASNRGAMIRNFDSADEAARWLASLETPRGSPNAR